MEWKPPDTIILSGPDWRAANDGAAGQSVGMAGGTLSEPLLLAVVRSLGCLDMVVK